MRSPVPASAPETVVVGVITMALVLVGVGIVAGISTPVTPAAGSQDAVAENLESIGSISVASGPRWSGGTTGGADSPPKPDRNVGSPVSDAETTTEARINPWGKRNVTVDVGGATSDLTEAEIDALQEAIAYWNEHHAAYTDREVVFEFTPDSARPDVVVEFVPYIGDCGGYDSQSVTVACAPRYDPGADADVPTTVRVRENMSGRGLETAVKHEFGHLLGLKHGEEPMPLMRERTTLQPTSSLENASERAFPWHDRTLTVAIEQDGSYSQTLLRSEVRKALSFYERGPAGWDGPNPRFEFVEDADRADIRLRVTRTDECDIGGGYCWTIAGEDLDEDEAIEYYTRFEATFGNLEARYLSWYAGRVVGYALGAENETALPRTFVDPIYADDDWFEPATGNRAKSAPESDFRGEETATEWER